MNHKKIFFRAFPVLQIFTNCFQSNLNFITTPSTILFERQTWSKQICLIAHTYSYTHKLKWRRMIQVNSISSTLIQTKFNHKITFIIIIPYAYHLIRTNVYLAKLLNNKSQLYMKISFVYCLRDMQKESYIILCCFLFFSFFLRLFKIHGQTVFNLSTTPMWHGLDFILEQINLLYCTVE